VLQPILKAQIKLGERQGATFYLKINKMGDDISVGTLGNVMRVLKSSGFYLEDTILKATPEAYPDGFVIGETSQPSQETRPKKHKERRPTFTCVLCNQSFEDPPHSNKIKKHLETCGKGISSCRYCHKPIESTLGLQKHETWCAKQKNKEDRNETSSVS